MSNETKRDVVLQLAKENRDLRMYDPESIEPKELIEQDYQDWIREYDAALPDDLPVIPKSWADTIEEYKANHYRLEKIFTDALILNYDEQDVVALAWLLGVWIVEETGEIVKLEDVE